MKGVELMFLITIAVTNNADFIKNNIIAQLEQLKQEGIDVIYEDYKIGDDLFIKCGIKDNFISRLTEKSQQDEFNYNISCIITNEIINFWESKLIKRIIKDNYFYLNEKEKKGVLAIAAKLLAEEKESLPEGYHKASRKNKVIRRVYEYLSIDKIIHIDGFVNFRLNEYINELSSIVTRAIELYIAEKEYNEFIKLLKYFVEIQECKIDIIHLFQADSGYVMLDCEGNRINGDYSEELKSEMIENEINFDDLLISTLITISPKRIILHQQEHFKNKELLQTIKKVFCEKIETCSGCKICNEQVGWAETNPLGI